MAPPPTTIASQAPIARAPYPKGPERRAGAPPSATAAADFRHLHAWTKGGWPKRGSLRYSVDGGWKERELVAKVAFCGLGRMGGPMARRLLGAGHDLSVWNRTPSKADALAGDGASVADTPAEAAAGAEFIITMLSDEHALEEVVWSHDGTAAGASFGATMIEMSTVGPQAVCGIRDRLPEDVELIDAPVLGSVPQATEGTLNILVGGDQQAFEHCRGLLDVMGTPRYVGKLGNGAALKLVFNSTLGTLMVALGEALSLAKAQGIDLSAALDVLELSHLKSIVGQKRSMIESGDHPANFALGMEAKDLRLVAEAAERGGVRLEGAALARRLFEDAAGKGFADQDYSALVTYLLGR